MKTRKIIVVGVCLTGKDTTLDLLKERLRIQERYSSGGFLRRMAKERGLSLETILEIADSDLSIDHEIDRRMREFITRTESFLIDTRIAHMFEEAKNCCKVLLTCNPKERIRRYRERHSQYLLENREVWTLIKMRDESDFNRYKKIYGFENPLDESKFDIKIDTSSLQPKEVASEICFNISELERICA